MAMDDRRFAEYLAELAEMVPVRAYEEAALDLAFRYPWARPAGSHLPTDAGVAPLREMAAAERHEVIERYTSDACGRLPILAIGSNAAPGRLRVKFAHFPDEADHEVLALTGRLHDFDVGASAQPAVYGSMPATIFPSQ